MLDLPKSSYKYFWDVNPAGLDVSLHSRYVIERLLEYGDFPELRWLFQNFSNEVIVAVLKKSNHLSRRRASAWANYLDVPRAEIKCLNKPFQKQHATTWTY